MKIFKKQETKLSKKGEKDLSILKVSPTSCNLSFIFAFITRSSDSQESGEDAIYGR